jgi:putative transposase
MLIAEYGYSERRACKLLEMDRSCYRYEPAQDRNEQLRQELKSLAQEKPRYGYRRLHVLLERRGWKINHKRLYRVYGQENLAVRRLKRKRLMRTGVSNVLLFRRNQEWAMDFVSDGLATGRCIRAFTVVDSYTRECLAIEVDSSLSSRRITRVLEWIIQQRGRPETLRCDNGPEFTSRHFLSWCDENRVKVHHIQPGKPMQNAHAESFNGRFRDECLNANWFLTLQDAKDKICKWRKEYNEFRPHSSLAYRTPLEFAACLTPSPSQS